jgi:hypothetical protein
MPWADASERVFPAVAAFVTEQLARTGCRAVDGAAD